MESVGQQSRYYPPPCGQGNRMWPVFGERAQHRNRNRVVRATLESSRALARTIRIQNFHMRLPCPCGGGLGRGVVHVCSAGAAIATPTPNPSPQGGGERAECAALSCIKQTNVL